MSLVHLHVFLQLSFTATGAASTTADSQLLLQLVLVLAEQLVERMLEFLLLMLSPFPICNLNTQLVQMPEQLALATGATGAASATSAAGATATSSSFFLCFSSPALNKHQ